MREAMIPTRSLLVYPGYRRVCVLAAITVDTCEKLNDGDT